MRTYTVVVFQDPDDPTDWLGTVPAVRAAQSCGDTKEHALAMTQEALETVLEFLIERGQTWPDDVPDADTARSVARELYELGPEVELHLAQVSVQARVDTVAA